VLLNQVTIFMVPVVNYDGYMAIGNVFNSTGTLLTQRKNMHVYPSQKKNCNSTDYGVDLNRNYGFMFAFDSKGSSGEENVCAADYRGPFAFSEPETAAMRDFISNWTNIKLAINFHAYGNLYVIPFNYDNKQNDVLNTKYAKAANFYSNVYNSGKMPA